MTEADSDYKVTVERGLGLFWMWRVARDGKSQTWGLASSEAEARSDAADAIEHHRQLADDDHVMGTILG